MEQLVKAIKAIREALENINKVLKLLGDQTNDNAIEIIALKSQLKAVQAPQVSTTRN